MIDFMRFVHPKDIVVHMDSKKLLRDHYKWYYKFGSLAKPKRFLEIGVAAGYSSFAFLSGCKDNLPSLVTWIDFCDSHGWDGNHDYALGLIRGAFDIDPDDRIINSHDVHSFDDDYDLIHIDGDHTFDGVMRDLRLVTRFMTDDGHVICHDAASEDVRNAIDQFCMENNNKFLQLNFPQIRCGVKIIHKANEHLKNCWAVNVQQMNIEDVK